MTAAVMRHREISKMLENLQISNAHSAWLGGCLFVDRGLGIEGVEGEGEVDEVGDVFGAVRRLALKGHLDLRDIRAKDSSRSTR